MVVGNGFTSVIDLLRSEKINEISNILLSVNISSRRLSATRENFSFRRSTPLSVEVDRDKAATTRLIGALPTNRLEQVLDICNRRGFTNTVMGKVMGTETRGPVRAALRLTRVVGRGIPRHIHHSKRPTEGDFRTLEVTMGSRLKILRENLSNTFRLLKDNKELTIVAFRSLRSEVMGRGVTS